MNCVQTPNSQQIACYVTNYGPAPSCANGTDADCSWPILEQAVDGAITADPIPPPPAQIYGFSIINNSNANPACAATFYAVNSFTAGQAVQISGLSVGTYFNGKSLIVLPTGLFKSQFETACPGSLPDALNEDSGTATYFNSNLIATVAMVYSGTSDNSNNPPANNITFYVYDLNGNLSPSATLDDEGPKSVPRMCMACHGGRYTPHSGTSAATVKGASFLPFDVLSFYYSSAFNKQYGVNPQQEAFRMLNLLVKTTNGGNQPQNPVIRLQSWILLMGCTVPIRITAVFSAIARRQLKIPAAPQAMSTSPVTGSEARTRSSTVTWSNLTAGCAILPSR